MTTTTIFSVAEAFKAFVPALGSFTKRLEAFRYSELGSTNLGSIACSSRCSNFVNGAS